jgi:hypothetical protein
MRRLLKDYFITALIIVAVGAVFAPTIIASLRPIPADAETVTEPDSPADDSPDVEPLTEDEARDLMCSRGIGGDCPGADDDACIVNGFGNELCGDSAWAYCSLELQNGLLTASNREVCESLGWVG